MLSAKHCADRSAWTVQLSLGAMVAVAVAARTLLAVDPDRYHAWRDTIVLVQRATCCALLLGGVALVPEEGWREFLSKCG